PGGADTSDRREIGQRTARGWRKDQAMKIASVADIKSRLSAYLKASKTGPVVVTRNGRPAAVIVGVQDEDEIERLLMAYSPRLQAILEASRKQIREGVVLTHDQFWAKVSSAKLPRGKKKVRAVRN